MDSWGHMSIIQATLPLPWEFLKKLFSLPRHVMITWIDESTHLFGHVQNSYQNPHQFKLASDSFFYFFFFFWLWCLMTFRSFMHSCFLLFSLYISLSFSFSFCIFPHCQHAFPLGFLSFYLNFPLFSTLFGFWLLFTCDFFVTGYLLVSLPKLKFIQKYIDPLRFPPPHSHPETTPLPT